jgi:hypothetical protein
MAGRCIFDATAVESTAVNCYFEVTALAYPYGCFKLPSKPDSQTQGSLCVSYTFSFYSLNGYRELKYSEHLSFDDVGNAELGVDGPVLVLFSTASHADAHFSFLRIMQSPPSVQLSWFLTYANS